MSSHRMASTCRPFTQRPPSATEDTEGSRLPVGVAQIHDLASARADEELQHQRTAAVQKAALAAVLAALRHDVRNERAALDPARAPGASSGGHDHEPGGGLKPPLATPRPRKALLQQPAKPGSTDRSLTGWDAGLPESLAGVPAFTGRCRGRAGARSGRSARLGGAEGAVARVREARAGMLARASGPGRRCERASGRERYRP